MDACLGSGKGIEKGNVPEDGGGGMEGDPNSFNILAAFVVSPMFLFDAL